MLFIGLLTKYFPFFLHNSNKSSTFASQLRNDSLVDAIEYRGVEQLVARQAHNLEVACSSPASATTKSKFFKEFRLFYFHNIVFTLTAGQTDYSVATLEILEEIFFKNSRGPEINHRI